MATAYRLDLTADEWDSIAFVGDRYSWSTALMALPVEAKDGNVPLDLTESEAWELAAAFEADTEGGHLLFPMLAMGSPLVAKLLNFMDSIV